MPARGAAIAGVFRRAPDREGDRRRDTVTSSVTRRRGVAARDGPVTCVPCTSTAMAANHAEAGRHVAAMTGWADHEHARAGALDGMTGMMGGGMGGMMDPAGLTSMSCRWNVDGTYTLAP